jgi:protein-tyrosine phosphatase
MVLGAIVASVRLRRELRYRSGKLVCDLADALRPQRPPRLEGEPEQRVLFVCLGNICRSPLAHGILRKRLADAGLYGRVLVDSAGTRVPKPGRAPDPRARLVARRHGVPVGDLRSRQLEPGDLDRVDRVVVFDEANRAAVLALAGDELRVVKLRDGDVADPILGRRSDFERTFAEIDEACARLVEELELDRAAASPGLDGRQRQPDGA